MKTYKNKNPKISSETTTVLFIQTNKEPNLNIWELCEDEEIKGDYLGSETYTEKGKEIIEKKYGKL